ncbi:DNA repair protein RecN [Mucinivorans hirudinis]|uniref:DNA repair protein RecN n=1 Tax=Mucinivorans hirudinis TaxID=1433126 RepID=A0A060R808_9BACT|nr:DNA repair protein RecN [Mucinivorans hirudinis]
MIRELRIENYAIIDSLSIDFAARLNTITGETGAGKSILLGALGLLAGGRAESAAFADNEKNCVIEGVFEIAGEEDFLRDNDIELIGNELIVRRVISPQGRSRAFINDEPVSLSVLKELSSRLVDIHSQHQTLLLNDENFQINIIDQITGYSTDNYKILYKKLKATGKELKLLKEQATAGETRAEFLRYQIEQIEAGGVNPLKISEQEERMRLLENATEIAAALGYTVGALDDEEHGVIIAIKNSLQALSRIRKNFTRADQFYERLNSLYLEAKDLLSEIEQAAEGIEINPAELETIQGQLDSVYKLFHRHNVETAEQLLDFSRAMQAELDGFENIDERVEKLEKEFLIVNNQAFAEAERLNKVRRGACEKIEKEVVAVLCELGIKDARFAIEISDTEELTSTGRNSVRMLFSANAGRALQGIESVASGGEMSRVMLAIKGLVSRSTELTTIVFDEIDTGVSGAVAHKMGEIIERMSARMQVLNITHLPQVASKGENHYLVYKDGSGTHIRKLGVQERIDHIAAMLSGSTVTEAARAQARQLLGWE